MATFYELVEGPARQDPLSMKANLVRAYEQATQIQRESANLTEEQVQRRYGFSGSQAQWNSVVNGVVAALETNAVQTVISQLGSVN